MSGKQTSLRHEDNWGEHQIIGEPEGYTYRIDVPDPKAEAHFAVDLFCRTEESKDTHRVPYTEVTIHPDGAGSDPVAYVRWFKDRIVIETENHVFATYERNLLDSMTQVTILVGRSGHFSRVLRGEQLRQFTGELIRIHIHGEPGLAAMLVWSKERHRQPLGHLVDPDLVRKEHNVKATL
jgi:hypothetical protein